MSERRDRFYSMSIDGVLSKGSAENNAVGLRGFLCVQEDLAWTASPRRVGVQDPGL